MLADEPVADGEEVDWHLLEVLFALETEDVPEETFDRLVEAQWREVDALPPGTPEQRAGMLLLVGLLSAAAQRFADPARDWEAVAVARLATREPVDEEERPHLLAVLMTALLNWYSRTGDVPALLESIEAGRLGLAADGGADRWALQANLGHALTLAFRERGDVPLLDEAIGLLRLAVAGRPQDEPESALAPMQLGIALHLRFAAGGGEDLLTEAVASAREAAAEPAADASTAGVVHTNLCTIARTAFEHFGAADLLAESIRVGRTALALLPTGDSNRHDAAAALGTALLARYKSVGDDAALRQARSLLQEVCATSRPDHPGRVGWLTNFADCLRTWFTHTGHIDVLVQAREVAAEAARADLANGPDRAVLLSTLADVLLSVHVHNQDPEVLDEAVRLLREAVQVTAGSAAAAVYLEALAHALDLVHKTTGERDALIEAIDLAHRAADAVADHRPARSRYLSGLGQVLDTGYRRIGDLTLLRRAVDAYSEALAITGADSPVLLSGAAGALSTLADRTGDVALLDQAVALYRSALAAVPQESPVHAAYMGSLGGTLEKVHRATGDRSAEREAIEVMRTAVAKGDLLPPISRASLLYALAIMLSDTDEADTDPLVLDEAAGFARRAVNLLPATEVHSAAARHTLAVVLLAKHRLIGDPSSLTEASRHFVAAAEVATAPPVITFGARWRSASTSALLGADEHAVSQVEQAAVLLPEIAPEALAEADRLHMVTSTAGFPATALAVLARAGRPERAAELLEQTRGILLTDAITSRSGVDELRAIRPDLADEVTRLRLVRTALNDPGEAPPAALRNRELWTVHWGRLLREVRALPGFDRFLVPPTYDELRAEATEGPIVYVAADERGGLALIVTRDEPIVVELPAADFRTVTGQLAVLRHADELAAGPSRDGWHAAQGLAGYVLAWTWIAIAEPVLDRLGEVDRLWWCPVGVVGALPLHAAGLGRGSGRSVLDRAVTSYTPTIRALARSRTTPEAPAGSLLVVAAPEATGAALPAVRREVARIAAKVPGATVLDADATRDQVLEQLPHHRFAHFACHGVADAARPAESRLLLADHRTHPLTVEAIARLRLTGAEIAYLSSCSTAETSARHRDEFTHLAGALQLAGFREVVGTLWPVGDRLAADLAERLYDRVVVDGEVRTTRGSTARALHQAVRELRAAQPHRPLDWAPYAHFGR
ncbi:CHAT domain-containing protein [Saccharothrix carnea]|uniref:CHAT domain-containing protein n=1 Tax=Saccharothrix carnea TaxID=1280637 RepID=A0A2P8I4A6_SACCR|nr:CHAT domain-containing protein [Saccharothrix carnea]